MKAIKKFFSLNFLFNFSYKKIFILSVIVFFLVGIYYAFCNIGIYSDCVFYLLHYIGYGEILTTAPRLFAQYIMNWLFLYAAYFDITNLRFLVFILGFSFYTVNIVLIIAAAYAIPLKYRHFSVFLVIQYLFILNFSSFFVISESVIAAMVFLSILLIYMLNDFRKISLYSLLVLNVYAVIICRAYQSGFYLAAILLVIAGFKLYKQRRNIYAEPYKIYLLLSSIAFLIIAVLGGLSFALYYNNAQSGFLISLKEIIFKYDIIDVIYTYAFCMFLSSIKQFKLFNLRLKIFFAWALIIAALLFINNNMFVIMSHTSRIFNCIIPVFIACFVIMIIKLKYKVVFSVINFVALVLLVLYSVNGIIYATVLNRYFCVNAEQLLKAEHPVKVAEHAVRHGSFYPFYKNNKHFLPSQSLFLKKLYFDKSEVKSIYYFDSHEIANRNDINIGSVNQKIVDNLPKYGIEFDREEMKYGR